MINGFVMKLLDGQDIKYEGCYSKLCAEIYEMIQNYKGMNYTVFLDTTTNKLVGYIEIEDDKLWVKSTNSVLNCEFWDFMNENIKTNTDGSPISSKFYEVFQLN